MDSQAELTVPADTSYVAMVRSATVAMAANADFTVDAMEDLRLAVDEACALIIADATPDSQMTIAWRASGNHLAIEVSGPSSSGAPVARDTFAWTVLSALVDEVEATVEADRQTIVLRAHGVESVRL